MSGSPRLSVVIPAYNEAKRIGPTLDRVLAYLKSRGESFEVLVVDDGSSDGTIETVARRGDPEVRVLVLGANKGKGAAVRRGVEESTGELVLITDADLAAPIEDLEHLEPFARNGHAVVCGSRALAESDIRIRQPLYRDRMGKMFNFIVRSLGLTSFHDTQCGFKLMRGGEAREIFARARIDRFAFDVEILYLADQLGFKTAEVPVSWQHVPESRVHAIVDSARMLWDVVALRLRAGIRSRRP